MSKRLILNIAGTVSLVLGGLIYIAFRENSYIASMLDGRMSESIRNCLAVFDSELTKFYLSDFLWAFSLSCYLLALWKPTINGSAICGAVTFISGVVFEILQYAGVISGTGDVLDIMMYLAASFCAVLINVKGKFK